MDCLPFHYLLILSIFVVGSTAAAGCSGGLRLRASDVRAKPEAQIDLSQLSEKQLQQLVQQLALLQPKQDADSLEDQDLEDLQQDEDDHRGSSRPWNRVQRIIRRQLVRIPKRYLKKLLRQFGLARSIAGGSGVRSVDWAVPQADQYYLIPLE